MELTKRSKRPQFEDIAKKLEQPETNPASKKRKITTNTFMSMINHQSEIIGVGTRS